MTGTNFSLRGAMNADNPDTAKIINGLLSGLMQQGISAVPDKDAQTILQSLKMTARESEIVIEADIPEKVVADFIQPTPPKANEVSQARSSTAGEEETNSRRTIPRRSNNAKVNNLSLLASLLLLVGHDTVCEFFRRCCYRQLKTRTVLQPPIRTQNDTQINYSRPFRRRRATGLLEEHVGTS